MTETKNKKRITGENLNFIIAICAILISGASFYATYLQADAANKQVKAMTLPMVQYSHGNVNKNDEPELSFSLINAGVGPAMIHSVDFFYNGKNYNNLFQVLNICCEQASSDFEKKINSPEINMPQFISNQIKNTIIPAQDEQVFLRLEKHPENTEIWNALNSMRFEIGFKACYCSLLDECFVTNELTSTQPVKSCE